MQKAIAPSQLGYYLERGYDRVVRLRAPRRARSPT